MPWRAPAPPALPTPLPCGASPPPRKDSTRSEGDTVTVRTPGGQKEYEIQSVEFVEDEVPGESGE